MSDGQSQGHRDSQCDRGRHLWMSDTSTRCNNCGAQRELPKTKAPVSSERDTEQTLEQLRSTMAGALLNLHPMPSNEALIMDASHKARHLLDEYTELKFGVLADGLVKQVREEVQRILSEALKSKPEDDQIPGGDDALLREFILRACAGAYTDAQLHKIQGLLEKWISV